jgi:hypothetical protein
LHQEFFSILYFFFTLPPALATLMATGIGSRMFTRGDVSFATFPFLPIWFAKLLEAHFFVLPKIDGFQVSLSNC